MARMMLAEAPEVEKEGQKRPNRTFEGGTDTEARPIPIIAQEGP